MKITEKLLSEWDACSEGKRTFTQRFPEGAEYKEVIAACDVDGHRDYRNWIFVHAFQYLEAKEIVEAETDLLPKEIEKGLEPLKTLESNNVKETDSVSKEEDSRLAASGDNSRLAASGYNSQLAASGYNSQLAASGDNSRLAASGRYSRLAASGDNSRLAASGENSVIAISGLDSHFSLGKGGCAAIPYRDESEKIRFAVAYEGENVKADTRYRVNAKGEFMEVSP